MPVVINGTTGITSPAETVTGPVVVNGATTNTNANWGYFINPKSGGAVGDFTVTRPDGNVSWLSIDGSGRVTMPYQPRFFASDRNTDSSGSNLVFTSTAVNVGSNYSTSTGRFTCPVAGTYMFMWGSLFGTNNTVGRFYLRLNGSQVVSPFNADNNQLRLDAGASGSEIASGEHSFVITASAGDYFNIYFSSDDTSNNDTSRTYSYFSGWLLA